MDLKEKFFQWRQLLIEKGELKDTSGRDTCWFKLLEHRQNPAKRKDWMDDITAKLIRSYFAKDETIKKDKVKKEQKNTSEEKVQDIIKFFVQYLSLNNTIPSFIDLEKFSNIKSNIIKKHFKSISLLLRESIKVNPEVKNYVFNEEFFTEGYTDEVLAKIQKHKVFVITTAVSGKEVHDGFYNALKNYAKRRNALVLILPCEDAHNRRSEYQWELHPKLKDFCVVYQDTYLNNNLFISDIKVSAKMLLPLTGLARMGQGKGSMILASTKQFLDTIPTSNQKLPIICMTTGSITENDYSNHFYMSKRLSKLAEHDHVTGAVVVEIEDDEIFHFRQLQVTEHDSIYDLDTEYFADGSTKEIEGNVMIFGDSHVSVMDKEAYESAKEIIRSTRTQDVVLHDVFNGECVSPHTINKSTIKAMNYLKSESSIEAEGHCIVEYLTDLSENISGKIVVVRSNHDIFLDRYIEEGRYVNDTPNLYFVLDIVKAYMEGKNTLKYLVEEKIGLPGDVEVKWLELDEDYKVHGVQLSNHGHIGGNGAKGSISNIERCYEKAIIAHSHSPGIRRGVYQVGTLSRLRLSYNHGPSSWLSGVALLYPNGNRTLLNIIALSNGKYSWKI